MTAHAGGPAGLLSLTPSGCNCRAACKLGERKPCRRCSVMGTLDGLPMGACLAKYQLRALWRVAACKPKTQCVRRLCEMCAFCFPCLPCLYYRNELKRHSRDGPHLLQWVRGADKGTTIGVALSLSAYSSYNAISLPLLKARSHAARRVFCPALRLTSP